MDEEKTLKIKEKSTKKLIDRDEMHQSVDQNVQTMINKPQVDPSGLSEENEKFLRHVMTLIEEEKIDLFRPETLMNHEIYDDLEEEKKGIADTNALPLLGEIRQIKKLYETGSEKTFQMKNLIERVRLYKERIENKCGDVYII
jgi:hypothetical protein